MTLLQAQRKLIEARNEYKRQYAEMNRLKEIIRSYGVHPDPRFHGIAERNEEIIYLHECGLMFKDIAAIYELSAGRVGSMCARHKKMLAKNDGK